MFLTRVISPAPQISVSQALAPVHSPLGNDQTDMTTIGGDKSIPEKVPAEQQESLSFQEYNELPRLFHLAHCKAVLRPSTSAVETTDRLRVETLQQGSQM